MLKYIIISTVVLITAISISYYFRQVCTQSLFTAAFAHSIAIAMHNSHLFLNINALTHFHLISQIYHSL